MTAALADTTARQTQAELSHVATPKSLTLQDFEIITVYCHFEIIFSCGSRYLIQGLSDGDVHSSEAKAR